MCHGSNNRATVIKKTLLVFLLAISFSYQANAACINETSKGGAVICLENQIKELSREMKILKKKINTVKKINIHRGYAVCNGKEFSTPSDDPFLAKEISVRFKEQLPEKPEVFLSVGFIEIKKPTLSIEYSVRATNVSKTGFDIYIHTADNTSIADCTIEWAAIPESQVTVESNPSYRPD